MILHEADRQAVQATFLRSRLRVLFLAGCGMLLVWTGTAAGLWRLNHPHWADVLTVGFAHLLAGRAISIAQGTYAGLPKLAITTIAVYADIMVMLLVYPVFVFSYENLFEGRFFQKRLKPMLDSAQSGMDRFGKGKAVGVFCFVWLPFWMTGIIAGTILGYLLGLRTWVTLLAASLGSLAAVASWVYAYDLLFRRLSGIHQEIPLAFAVLLLATLVWYPTWRRRKGRRVPQGRG